MHPALEIRARLQTGSAEGLSPRCLTPTFEREEELPFSGLSAAAPQKLVGLSEGTLWLRESLTPTVCFAGRQTLVTSTLQTPPGSSSQ